MQVDQTECTTHSETIPLLYTIYGYSQVITYCGSYRLCTAIYYG